MRDSGSGNWGIGSISGSAPSFPFVIGVDDFTWCCRGHLAATIRNKNTRMAYYRAVTEFFAWIERHKIGQLADIEPIHVAAYVEALQGTAAKPTVKRHLAAIRMCFDWLVTGGVLTVNPAHALRGPKHVVKRGKTPVLTTDQARLLLLDSIDTSTLIGLCDRALIGVMTYFFARVGAVVAMRVEDYFANGKRWWVRLHEKGGKRHEMPTSTNTSKPPASAMSRKAPCSAWHAVGPAR